jgi:hypothetical protein
MTKKNRCFDPRMKMGLPGFVTLSWAMQEFYYPSMNFSRTVGGA